MLGGGGGSKVGGGVNVRLETVGRNICLVLCQVRESRLHEDGKVRYN